MEEQQVEYDESWTNNAFDDLPPGDPVSIMTLESIENDVGEVIGGRVLQEGQEPRNISKEEYDRLIAAAGKDAVETEGSGLNSVQLNFGRLAPQVARKEGETDSVCEFFNLLSLPGMRR